MAFVVDCSVTLPLCFDDESSALSERIALRLAAEQAIVPAVWWFEVRNALIVAERRNRIDPDRVDTFLTELERLPIRVMHTSLGGDVVSLARAHRLTVYDAAYLDLALHARCPLATLDEAMISAAKAVSVEVLTA